MPTLAVCDARGREFGYQTRAAGGPVVQVQSAAQCLDAFAHAGQAERERGRRRPETDAIILDADAHRRVP
jgi:hypothetical protein